MDTILPCLLFLAALVAATSALQCAPCNEATCTPPPPGCELGTRVCSCCHECRVKEQHACGPFSPECESHLVCFTNQGVFVGRPPWSSSAQGRCIKYADVPVGSTAGHMIGRSVFGRK
ncbi:serine protease HTRA1-like [Littorina saxatilis]|uniref:IGFBP N-terminal domain-containing protein n=1 Tax=Littorina saxatilis TaxID=31220 RepID=A0AAN9GAR7_9CAEN